MSDLRGKHTTLLATLALLLAMPFAVALPALAADGWLDDARKASTIQAPFKRTMYAGEVTRVRLEKNKALLITVDDNGKGGGVIAIPTRKGERVGEKQVITVKDPVLFFESASSADSKKSTGSFLNPPRRRTRSPCGSSPGS